MGAGSRADLFPDRGLRTLGRGRTRGQGRDHQPRPAEVGTAAEAARLAPGTRVLAQPRRLRPPRRPASWWDYRGPLVVVFNGGPRCRAGELVLPARLAQGAGRWPHLVHYLACPERWHKVDPVRRRDASAIGGWAYEAHLMVLGQGAAHPLQLGRGLATQRRRRLTPTASQWGDRAPVHPW